MKTLLRKMLQQPRIFLTWLFSPKNVGGRLPILLASLLFIFLVFHVSFEVWQIICEAIRINGSDSLLDITPMILQETALTIASDAVRNLGLLLVASIVWFFLYWRATAADQSVNVEKLTRAVEQLTDRNLSVRLGGVLGLEQIAKTHKGERARIIEIILARIRELIQLRKENKRTLGQAVENADIETTFRALANIVEPLGDKKRKVIHLESDLSGLVFTEIDLSYFPLGDKNLSNAIFWNVDFTGTDLSRASISNAVFKNCKNLTEGQIKRALWKEGCRPRGLPEKWNLPSKKILSSRARISE